MTRTVYLLPLLLTACQTSDETPQELYDGPAFGQIAGYVTSADGSAIGGVEVIAQGFSAQTDANGYYEIDGVDPAETIIVEFTKSGYATGYSRASLISWETISVNKTMLDIDGFGTFDAQAGGTVEVAVDIKSDDGRLKLRPVTVGFEPSAVVDADGNRYDGEVRVEVTYVDPYGSDAAGAPGDLQALKYPDDDSSKNASEPTQLVSYGMADISLFGEDGDKLNMGEGDAASVVIPITNGELVDVYVVEGGEEMETWSWDSSRGLWVEEGIGLITTVTEEVEILDEDPSSPTYGEVIETEVTESLAFKFEASHFSWWNCDQGYVPTYACGRVVDMLGFPVRSAEVVAQGSVTNSVAYTDENGWYEITVMAGDTVNFTGNTIVAGSNWNASQSMFIDGGESQDSCVGDEVPDIDIQVCRESGIVMTDNIDSQLPTQNDANADRLRAWFWEAPGTPSECDNPWDQLQDECFSYDPADFSTQQSDPDGFPHRLRSVGDWLEISNGRDTYTMDETRSSNGRPHYTWLTEEYDASSEEYLSINDIEFEGGDVLSAQAPGNISENMGAISQENWVTIPSQLIPENLSAMDRIDSRSGMKVNFSGQGGDDGIIVFGTGESGDSIVCKFHDDGDFTVSKSSLDDLGTGYATFGLYRGDLDWTAGPDGMPIRIQAFSGTSVTVDLQ